MFSIRHGPVVAGVTSLIGSPLLKVKALGATNRCTRLSGSSIRANATCRWPIHTSIDSSCPATVYIVNPRW